MHNLKRFYDQNRKEIWMAIIIIASIFILLQLLNYFARKNNEKELNNSNNIEKIVPNSSTSTNVNLKSSKSAITGESISEQNLNTAKETIEKFIDLCNARNLEEAYDMLTEECKNQMYTSVDVFEQAYYKNVFNGEEKSCNIENWTGDIYKVNIVGDMLATGKSNNGYTKQDYIIFLSDVPNQDFQIYLHLYNSL